MYLKLTNRKTVAEFGPGTFPDGLTFDENGSVWITSIVSNRILKVSEDGDVQCFLEDVDDGHLDWVESAWRNNSMNRQHLDKAAGRVLSNISNLAFCGANFDKAVFGCLLDDKLAMLDMPVCGYEPFHWNFDIGPLVQALSSLPAVTGQYA